MTTQRPNKSRTKKAKRKKKIIIILSSITIVLAAVAIIGIVYSNNLLSKVSRTEIDNSDLGIKKEVSEKIESSEIKDIVNVALLGIDDQGGGRGRSDAIMIGTFDPVNKKLKITSIMRDTYVDIPGHGKDKLNHAYAYGGPQLTLKTLNENFNLNITDYISINFDNLAVVVDALGGIDVEVSQDEYFELTYYINDVNERNGYSYDNVYRVGGDYIHLDGYQALSFCRIRSTDGGDFDRTERHRRIMAEMFNKISEAGTSQLVSLVTQVLPHVETSLTNKEILNLGVNVLNLGTSNLEQERFPRDEYQHGSTIDDVWYLCYDEDYTAEQMYEYIFNNKKIWLDPNAKVYDHDKEHHHGTSNTTNGNGNTNSNNNNNNSTPSTNYTQPIEPNITEPENNTNNNNNYTPNSNNGTINNNNTNNNTTNNEGSTTNNGNISNENNTTVNDPTSNNNN